MKKRLLSAALALAMVLTLLPVSAFAADTATSAAPGDGTAVQYVSGTDNTKATEGGTVTDQWTWQYKSTADGKTYWATAGVSTGIVTGTTASGTYYASPYKADGSLVSTSFTLVGSVPSLNPGNAATLSVNVFGNTLGFTDLRNVNSLTITDTKYTQYRAPIAGSVSLITRDVQNYITGTSTFSQSGLTLNVTGADVGRIDLKGRGNKVTLTGVTQSGGITLDGETKVTTTSGTTTTYPAQTLDIKSLAAQPNYGMAAIPPSVTGGGINVTGDASQVNLSDVTGGQNVIVTGTGANGKVYVDGNSDLGSITVNSRDQNAKDAPPVVTIHSGTVTGITRTGEVKSTTVGNITVDVNGYVNGSINTQNGNVSIASGHTKDITVTQGTVSISGSSAQVDDLNLGAGAVTLNVSGTGHQVKDINNTGTLTIGNSWPADRGNTFGNLNLGTYTGQGIKGGTFATDADSTAKALWFSPDLQFTRQDSNGNYVYYGKKELSTAIADGGANAVVNVIGSLHTNSMEFYNSLVDATGGKNRIATLKYSASTGIYLPDKINGTPVATWIDAAAANGAEAKTYSVNELVSLSSGSSGIKLVLQSSGAVVSKLTNVSVPPTYGPGVNNNANVTATLTGNQIVLSGAVGQTSFEDVVITLTTDLIDSDGNAVTFNVSVSYDTTNKVSVFSTLGLTPPPAGVTVNNTTIVVGSTTYTLSTSGLAKPASNLKIAGVDGGYSPPSATEIAVTVNGNMTPGMKADIIDKISGGSASFDWQNSPAVRQAVNAAMATITANNQLDSWATAAQRAAWQLANKGTPNATDLANTKFDEVWLVPYLAVTVTAYNNNGTMTATMVPSYRVEVRQSASAVPYNNIFMNRTNGTADGNYLAQAGRPIPNLISDLTGGGSEKGVELTFNLSNNFNYAYAHQDDTYVYQLNNVAPYKMTLTHAGKSGLGTLVFGKIDPKMHLKTTKSDGTTQIDKYYDNLQAAVDDAKNGDTLTVYSNYTGSGTINVTGAARKFTIVTMGNTTITPASNNFTVDVDATGHTYTVQLQKNVTPVGGNIIVTDVTGGSASVNVNPAAVGQTVTITLTPATGYTAAGVSVRTNGTNGTASTSVSVSGSGNTFTFTMPADSVTVTPSFRQNQTTATVSVSNSTGMGTTTTTAASTNNRVTPGSVVGVYTTPSSGYRTMGVTVTTNGSGATAVRQGDNYFTFTVPSNATAVTVTPIYDRDNGTKFQDVWSTEYYSNPVAWAVSSGVTDGTGTYTFSPGNNCTRAQMVTFLWRAAGRPSVANIRNPFTDVSSTLTPGDFYSAILWAVSKGITQGKTTTTFAPNEYITRAQAVTFLYRFENSPTAGTTSKFYDVSSREYYAKAVSWAANRSVPITTGTTATAFSPNQYVTRAQAVTFLYRDRTNKLA